MRVGYVQRPGIEMRVVPGIKTEPEDRTWENLNTNPNIPKTELPKYILDSKFQNLNTFQVSSGNN
jgi:hypothetical protein